MINSLLILLILIFFSTREARAQYLDPGSSSYLLQILMAGFFSGLLVVKIFWKKILSFLNVISQSIMGKSKTDNEKKNLK